MSVSLAKPYSGPWDLDSLINENTRYHIVDDSGPIYSILYEGERVHEHSTEVFAFYASPLTLDREYKGDDFPGIVLIHGGGGTAYSDWVWKWAQHGFAAIAMDLSGRMPPQPQFDSQGNKIRDNRHPKELRVALENGGLDHTRIEKFESIGGSYSDDWPYHAIANGIKAHNVLRKMPGVNAKQTAVTGISWGGYTTSIVASLDNRFKAAIPVYGCGFLYEGESVQKPLIDELGDKAQLWIDKYDPSQYLGYCEVPIFWVNGTNDRHYPLDSFMKSYHLVNSPKKLRIEPGMKHSHEAGWKPDEIMIHLKSLFFNEPALPVIHQVTQLDDGRVQVEYTADLPIKEAALHFTEDKGLRSERKWRTIEAKIHVGKIITLALPTSANTWLVTLTDERGTMVSTEAFFR